MDLNTLCEVAKKAALAAGEIIRSHQGKNHDVKSKQGGENLASQVVTEIDLKAEQAILEILNPTLAEYDLGLLAEETASECTSRFEKKAFWCIDPLDGTLCFSRDEDGYSTSIGLVGQDGIPLVAAVYNPRSQTLYHAIKDQGAYKNGEVFTVPKWSDELTLLYDQSFLKHPTFDEEMNFLENAAKKLGLNGVKMFHLGGAVMNGITTIEMAPAVYYKLPKKADGGGSIWDFAASSLIQREAGGFNSDFHGKPLNLNRFDTTFMNHDGIIYCSDKRILEVIPKIQE
jgi:fructose-1,6-bisphosphatase/inositol monophosphatase family enzyme